MSLQLNGYAVTFRNIYTDEVQTVGPFEHKGQAREWLRNSPGAAAAKHSWLSAIVTNWKPAD